MNDNENKTTAPTKLPDLLPCPFCGSAQIQLLWAVADRPGIVEEDFGYGADGPEYALYSIECDGCAMGTDSYGTASIIVDKWNARAAIKPNAAGEEGTE